MISKRMLCVAAACLACSACPGQSDDTVLGAYFINWGIYGRSYYVSNLPPRQVTHIFYAFAEPHHDSGSDAGALVSFDPGADALNIPALQSLKADFPHLRTLISVGGWTLSDDFSDIMSSSNARATFASSCIAFMTNGGFDGIDFDWEYPVEGGEPGLTHRADDADNYLTFVHELRTRLDQLEQDTGDTYLVTIAASAAYDSLTNRFHIAEMSQYLDWINVMTYDFAGPWDAVTGHLAPLYGNPGAVDSNYNVHTSIATFLSEGVPASKLAVGLPYYGRSFSGVDDVGDGLFQSHSGSGPGTREAGVLDYSDCLANYVNTNGYTRHWDPVSKAATLYCPTSQVFVTYEDPESIAYKMEYVSQQGLRGVMCWSIDADTAQCNLQRTVYRSLVPLDIESADVWINGEQRDCRLAWIGISGETYTLHTCDSLLLTNWAACTTLAETNGDPILTLVGDGYRIDVVDTNVADPGPTFYRLRAE